MPILSIQSIWLHDIDQTKGTAIAQAFSAETDVTDFVHQFVGKISGLKSRREFRFPRNTVEACTLILRIYAKDQGDQAALLLAQKLAIAEKTANEKYGHLGAIQAGNLLLVFFQLAAAEYALIAKVDLLKVLEKSSLKYREGLPVDHYVMKACLIRIDNGIINAVSVSDSNSGIAAYWSEDFLGLEALRDSTYNTTKVFDTIDKLLVKSVKSSSLSDYRRMRGTLLGYLKNQPQIIYTQLVESVFGTYEPDNDTIDVVALKQKLAALPDKYGFDTQFAADPKSISKRRIHTIPLTPHLELTIKDDDAVTGTVKPVIENGRKAVRIFSDVGYDYFQSQ